MPFAAAPFSPRLSFVCAVFITLFPILPNTTGKFPQESPGPVSSAEMSSGHFPNAEGRLQSTHSGLKAAFSSSTVSPPRTASPPIVVQPTLPVDLRSPKAATHAEGLFHRPGFLATGSHHHDVERSVSPREVPSRTSTPRNRAIASQDTPNSGLLLRQQAPSFIDIMQEQLDLRMASANNPTVVMELDLLGNIKHISRNWELLVGTSVKKIINRPISYILVGNDDEDLQVFNHAIEQMIRDDASYKVKFVTATGGRVDGSSISLLPPQSTRPLGDALARELANDDLDSLHELTERALLDPELASDENVRINTQYEMVQEEAGSSSSASSVSSQVSNNGDVIELEAQGILIHDTKTQMPTHTIWTIKPFMHIDLDLSIPQNLIDLLGFGLEIFEGFLLSLKEMGIMDEASVPQPKSILCRICEQNIPAWYIEKHSEDCIVEHRVGEELQNSHDAIADHRDLLIRISESLWNQQHPENPVSSPGLSTGGLILDYKGVLLPTLGASLPADSSPLGSPRLQTTHKTVSPLQSILQSQKFPFGILTRLIELCDEALSINPAERVPENDNQLQFSPNTEQGISSILNWKRPFDTSDLAMKMVIEDTQQLVNDKMATLSRLISFLQYSDKLKREVDELVLESVKNTVHKIREQIRLSEQDQIQLPYVQMQKSVLQKSSFYNEGSSASSVDDRTATSHDQTLLDPVDLLLNALNARVLHLPQPSRTRSPSNLFSEPYFKEDNLGPPVYGGKSPHQSITPKDILLRGRSLHGDLSRHNLAVSLASTGSLSAGNSRNNSKDTNLLEASLHELDLKRNSELLSNNLSFSSLPRRHLLPAPYVEKQSLSTLQRNTNSRFETASPLSSPYMAHSDLNDSLPSPALHHFEGRMSSGGSTGSASNSHHLSVGHGSAKNTISKPPLSPLLVSQAPSAKPSSGHIKDYDVLKAISKGAFGSVFLAKRKLTGDYVAIKCLKKRDMIAKNQILNVRSERAVMMKQADSPYVAQLYSSFQTKDYLYLVMEYLSGGDCSTLLKMLGTLGNEWAKRYIAEVIVGVDDLHKRGIIHRDLKPDNLLIDSKGHLKLTDFGLLRFGVVGRQARQHRNSSTSESGIELFRRSLAQGSGAGPSGLSGTVSGPSGSGSGTYGSQHSTPALPGVDSPLLDVVHHKRTASVTPFSLSPTLENTKLQGMAHGPSSGPGAALISSPTAGFTEAFGQHYANTSNSHGSRPGSFLKKSSRSGSSPSTLESPILKPFLPRTSSELLFALVDDDFQVSPSQNPNPVTSYALYDVNGDNNREFKNFVGTPDYLSPETVEGVGQEEYLDWWSIGCIFFEFIFGYPPFHAETPEKVFKNILVGEIDWPPLLPEEEKEICPPSAKDLIRKLLARDPQKRLGYNGADEVKRHPYFRGIRWESLYDEIPSFIPTLDDPESTDYFDARGADISQFPKDDSDEDVPKEASEETELKSPPAIAATLGPAASAVLAPPGTAKRERRGSKLADPSEFGSFHFRNLNVLEKANKDVINRLKNEHLEHRNSFLSLLLLESTPLSRSRSRGYSFNGTPQNPGSPFKRPVLPVAVASNRAPSPGKIEKENLSPQSPAGFLPLLFKHERVGLAVSTYSSGDEFPFGDAGKLSPNDHSAGGTPKVAHRPSVHSLSKQVFTKSSPDLNSPSSSDTEESKLSALLRVRKRRESLLRSLGSGPGMGSKMAGNGSATLTSNASLVTVSEMDILYCEPIPIVRHTVTKLMERLGCVVVAVADGDELIRRATSQVKFDVIFTALRLAKVDAVDAVKLIKYTTSVNCNTHTVALTAFAKDAVQSGVFDDVLEKPVDVAALKGCLVRCRINSEQWPLQQSTPLQQHINEEAIVLDTEDSEKREE